MFPEKPKPPDTDGIVGTAVAGVAGVFSPEIVWRSILAHELDWNAVYDDARARCERKPSDAAGATKGTP